MAASGIVSVVPSLLISMCFIITMSVGVR